MDKVKRIKELTKELLQYCHEYYDLDAPTISDAEYDEKFDQLLQLENQANFWLADSPTRKVQGQVLPYLKKVHHSVPMLSADKSTDIKDVKKFVGNRPVVISYKLDGSTVVVKYENGKFIQALSRGSGIDGEDITHTARMIKNLPMMIPYKGYLEIRGEALIPWKCYNEINSDNSLGHPRNVASGGLRQLDANEAAKRNIYFYAFTLVNWQDVSVSTKFQSLHFLYQNGFDVVPHVRLPEFGDGTIETALKFLDRKSYENPTDGWCFEYDDLVYGESLGSTGHHDRRLFALKPEVEEYETTLRNIEWTIGKTGQLTPTAVFDPTEIDNTIITKASVHNISIIKSLNLKIGGKCSVYKANMIIPQILRCQGGDQEIAIPQFCPVCGGRTAVVKDNQSEVLTCTNPNCSGKLLAKFTHFVSRNCANIDGLSEKTLEALISRGFLHTFKDIYHLKEHKNELVNIEGLGEKSVTTLLESIEKSRDIKLENFITALGIPNIGKSAAQTISNAFHGDHYDFIQAFTYGYDFTQLEDFGEVMNKSLYDWWNSKDPMIELLPMEFNFILPTKVEVKDNPLNGIKFCITGSFSQSRDKLKERLEAKGAKFMSGVSKNLDVLFVGEKAGSKLTKAQNLGIRVAYEDELMKLLGE